MHVVPHFGGDEQLFAPDGAFGQRFMKRFADQVFIAIHRGAVKHAVTAADGAGYGLGYLHGRIAVAAKRTHAYAGNVFSRVKRPLGYVTGMDEFCHVLPFFACRLVSAKHSDGYHLHTEVNRSPA